MARYGTVKKWGKHFGVSQFGETKKELYEALVKYMASSPDELDEEMLEWYQEQTGKSEKKKPEPKKRGRGRPKKEEPKEEPEVKKPIVKKRRKKATEPEPVEKSEEEKPIKKRRKKETPSEEGTQVAVTINQIVGFADELGIEHGEIETEDAARELAENIIEFVDSELDEADREELSKELFTFYSTVKAQEIGGDPPATTEEELPIPSVVKLKVWAKAVGVDKKGKDNQRLAREILFAYSEIDEREDLPDSLVAWATPLLGEEPVEEEETPDLVKFELPDYDTLKAYGKAVGLRMKDILQAKKDRDTLGSMVLQAYDVDEEDDYPPELKEFYHAATTGQIAIEENEEQFATRDYLVSLGYEEGELEDFDDDECNEVLLELYKEEEELSDEAVEFLKETFPEVFEPKKKESPKKVRRRRKK